MTGSSRKPGIVICIPLRKFRNEQVRECAAAVHALVFLLARAGIMKRKISKMGRAVAGNAIADRLTGRNQAWPCARPREEDSQPGQFLRTKVKTLFQGLEAPIRLCDKPRLFQITQEREHIPHVITRRLS